MSHQVKYLGPTEHTREITKAQAKNAGFILASDLQWTLASRHTLILDDLDETAVEFFNESDEFRVKEVSDDEDAPTATGKAAADLEVQKSSEGGAAGSGSSATTGRGRTTTSTTTATT